MVNLFTCELILDVAHVFKFSSPCAYLEIQLLDSIARIKLSYHDHELLHDNLFFHHIIANFSCSCASNWSKIHIFLRSFVESGTTRHGWIEDQSGINLTEQSMIAYGSKDYTDRLASEMSRSDQVPNAGLSVGSSSGCQVKTFGVVVIPRQMLGPVAHFEEVTPPHIL
ncbi:hypothetical protein M9H77_34350 [Catharanthus roseus]|uniref:Uncharacterized protein n=1 Tax=Catharanthus roseus TaxID=4058 RepID=A0ACB9ZLN7_CATRO|nr:hypothetical protein M9H77_34350 [Catharanthus roseus]